MRKTRKIARGWGKILIAVNDTSTARDYTWKKPMTSIDENIRFDQFYSLSLQNVRILYLEKWYYLKRLS